MERRYLLIMRTIIMPKDTNILTIRWEKELEVKKTTTERFDCIEFSDKEWNQFNSSSKFGYIFNKN